MLTADDYFGRVSRAGPWIPSDEVKASTEILLTRVNALLERIAAMSPSLEAAVLPVVNSGWRPAEYNATVPGAAPRSRHITGEAIDLADPEGELDDFLVKHIPLLVDAGLWMEHPLATKGWCHLQSVPPKSGNRVFYP